MPVCVFDDIYKTRCLCVVDDDGKVYLKPDSPYNSTSREQIGNIDCLNRVYYGRDRYDEAGAYDDDGYVYRDIFELYPANRVGYVEGDRVYEEGPSVSGYSPMSSPIAYMEGDGDMKRAGAAALLLYYGKGKPRERRSSSYSSGGGGGGSHKSTPAQNKNNGRQPLDAGGCLGICFIVAVVLIIIEKLFG